MKTLERILNALKESNCFVGDIDEAIAEVKAKDEEIERLENHIKNRLDECVIARTNSDSMTDKLHIRGECRLIKMFY